MDMNTRLDYCLLKYCQFKILHGWDSNMKPAAQILNGSDIETVADFVL